MTSIDVYADVSCPFAHLGIRSVARRRKELGRGDVIVRVRAWPLELVIGQGPAPGWIAMADPERNEFCVCPGIPLPPLN